MEQIKRLPKLSKSLDTYAWGITAFLIVVIVALQYITIPLPDGIHFLWLPPVYSVMNALAGVCLILALYFIKKGDVKNHQRSTFAALILSVLFVLMYVAYHLTTDPTRFGGEGTIKYVYLFLLATHIICSAVSLPLILFTFIRAYAGMIPEHRKLAKITYPMWLYVCITGPICYLMLKPYYPAF